VTAARKLRLTVLTTWLRLLVPIAAGFVVCLTMAVAASASPALKTDLSSSSSTPAAIRTVHGRARTANVHGVLSSGESQINSTGGVVAFSGAPDMAMTSRTVTAHAYDPVSSGCHELADCAVVDARSDTLSAETMNAATGPRTPPGQPLVAAAGGAASLSASDLSGDVLSNYNRFLKSLP
jgi:hypothetical protein